MARKLAQRQVYASVSGIDGNFSQFSGGEISSNAEKIYDGGSITPTLLSGARDVGNITLVRPVDLDRDPGILANLRDLVGKQTFTVTVFVCDADLQPISTRVYNDALLIGMNEPEGDAASGAPASMSLVFSVGGVTSVASRTA